MNKSLLVQANVPKDLFRKVVERSKRDACSQADVVRAALRAYFGAERTVETRLRLLESRVFGPGVADGSATDSSER